MRSIRISNAVWDEAEQHASGEGVSMTDLVDRLLRRYNAARRRYGEPAPSAEQRE